MKIALYTTMPLSTDFSGIYGITSFMFPLIRELSANGNTIQWVGKTVENKTKSDFAKLTSLKPDFQDISSYIEVPKFTSEAISRADALLIYNRPKEAEDEFAAQNHNIEVALDNHVPVLFWDGDNWFSDVSKSLRDNIILLRPYLQENQLATKQYEFLYFIDEKQIGRWETTQKPIDVCYIGNQYNRQESFERFFGPLRKSDLNVVVAGNWLKNEEKRRFSQRFMPQFNFIGELPYQYTLPLLSKSKYTIQIVKEDYRQLGLMTARLFEAVMAGTLCLTDNSIFGMELFSPFHLRINDGAEALVMMDIIKRNDFYEDLVQVQRNYIKDMTAKNAAKKLEEIIENDR